MRFSSIAEPLYISIITVNLAKGQTTIPYDFVWLCLCCNYNCGVLPLFFFGSICIVSRMHLSISHHAYFELTSRHMKKFIHLKWYTNAFEYISYLFAASENAQFHAQTHQFHHSSQAIKLFTQNGRFCSQCKIDFFSIVHKIYAVIDRSVLIVVNMRVHAFLLWLQHKTMLHLFNMTVHWLIKDKMGNSTVSLWPILLFEETKQTKNTSIKITERCQREKVQDCGSNNYNNV